MPRRKRKRSRNIAGRRHTRRSGSSSRQAPEESTPDEREWTYHEKRLPWIQVHEAQPGDRSLEDAVGLSFLHQKPSGQTERVIKKSTRGAEKEKE